MAKTLYYNQSIRELLSSIATLNPMLGPGELISLWYDELYFPSQKDADLYKPGEWEQGQKEWESCFNSLELEALRKFHCVFDSVIDKLCADPIAFDQDPNWHKVQKAAEFAIREMEASYASQATVIPSQVFRPSI